MDKKYRNLNFQLSNLFEFSQNVELVSLKYHLNQNFKDLNSTPNNLLQIIIKSL